MPKLIKNGQIQDNNWTQLNDEDALTSGNILVSLTRWQSDADALKAHEGAVGIVIEPGEGIATIRDQLDQLPVVAIHFPSFADGRGYSYARELRQQLSYQGEIRAIGDVLKDQMNYLYRSGFDAFAIRADRSAEDALAGLTDFTENYQADARGEAPIYSRK